MALKIYESANPTSDFSVSGLYTNPLATTIDGATGQVVERKYYVGNDNSSFTYSGISVQAADNSGLHLIDGTVGFSWKLISEDTAPLETQWATVNAANSITLANIDDTNTYLPFWLRIEVPRATRVQSFDGIVLRVTATEE